MGTILDISGTRDNAGYVSVPARPLKPGCRGAACPAFAICQGRCGTGAASHADRAALVPAAEYPSAG